METFYLRFTATETSDYHTSVDAETEEEAIEKFKASPNNYTWSSGSWSETEGIGEIEVE